MPTITLWEAGDVRCVLGVMGNAFDVKVLDGEEVLREHRAASADEAITLGNIWKGARLDNRASSRAQVAPRRRQQDRAKPTQAAKATQMGGVYRYPMGVARGFIW